MSVNNTISETERPRIAHLVSLYVPSAVLLTLIALILQQLSVSHIRKLHPHFPQRVSAAVYTPSTAYLIAHAFGPVGILLSIAVFAGAFFWCIRKNRITG